MESNEWLNRNSPFSYSCMQCNRCCVNKIIKLNPYEVARLAANRGISTTEFIRTYTLAHGAVLKITNQGDCVFRTQKGCSVHPDRPFVCRIYPLGRHTTTSGEERFFLMASHPESEGVFGMDGTVADYLQAQGIAPYVTAIDKYMTLLGRLFAVLQGHNADGYGNISPLFSASPDKEDQGVQLGLELLDMDLVVSEYCARQGVQWPLEVDAKMEMHIRAVEENINRLQKGA